jgi:hypothetical protein
MDHSKTEPITSLEARYHEAVEQWTRALAVMYSKSNEPFWVENHQVKRCRIEAQSLRYEIEQLKRSAKSTAR